MKFFSSIHPNFIKLTKFHTSWGFGVIDMQFVVVEEVENKWSFLKVTVTT